VTASKQGGASSSLAGRAISFNLIMCFFDRWSGMTKLWLSRSFLSRSNCLCEPHQLCLRRESPAVIEIHEEGAPWAGKY